MEANYFTVLYWFCHISTWICHECTRVPYPEPPSYLLPHTIPLGHPSAPAPSILYHESNMDWCVISHMIIYMFHCHSPKSSHPHPLPQSPEDCSTHFIFLYFMPSHFFLQSIHGILYLIIFNPKEFSFLRNILVKKLGAVLSRIFAYSAII